MARRHHHVLAVDPGHGEIGDQQVGGVGREGSEPRMGSEKVRTRRSAPARNSDRASIRAGSSSTMKMVRIMGGPDSSFVPFSNVLAWMGDRGNEFAWRSQNVSDG